MADAEWLTVNEIAERLKVTPQTVQRWLRAKELAGLNLGGKAGYRVRRADLDAFIRARFEGNAAA
ncbi:MAG TPA: helix-turn-helix domain-containing protein [Chloroflexota bacterium]